MVLGLLGLSGCGGDCEFTEDFDIICDEPLPPEPSPTATSTPIPEPTSEPISSNPTCSDVMGTDGPGGFLWKPKSESGGTLVVLLPGKFQSTFESVQVHRRNRVEELRFTGYSNFDQDGERQTWRASRPGEAYTGRVEARGGNPLQTCVWVVDNPSRRQD